MLIHELAPISHRSPNLLARAYGYESVEAFAANIPPEGHMVDIGAGASGFGRAVALERPDVQVTLMDRCYQDRADREGKVPSNLRYVHGDILDPPLEHSSFDRVTSSALLPHIIMTDHHLALRAVHNMAELLRPNGRLQIAGFVGRRILTGQPTGPVVTIDYEQYQRSPDVEAITAVDRLTLVPAVAVLQQMVNLTQHHMGQSALIRQGINLAR